MPKATVALAFGFGQVPDRMSQDRPWETRHMSVEVGAQSLGVVLPGLTDETANSRLHDLLGVVGEEVGERKGVVQIAAANEVPGCDDGRPSSPPVRRA